jgi:hypothetical protein
VYELLRAIPTGNNDCHRDILCACKNGLADCAVVFANGWAHLMLGVAA